MPAKFPLIHMYSQEAVTALGYTALAVSAFDHWLTEAEAADRLMGYHAVETSAEAQEYSSIENLFWKLHLALSDGPTFRVRHGGDLVRVSPGSRHFRDLWRQSRRERRLRGRFIDLYYERPRARIIQNWDLTDWAFLKDESARQDFETAVLKAGLHVLRPRV